jgi:hypothetical protein
MDMTTPRAARPFDPASSKPILTVRPHGPHLALDMGSLWVHGESGETFTLTGRRRTGVHLLGVEGMVPIADLLARYTWAGCSHQDYCCSTHGEHRMPHVGCILR